MTDSTSLDPETPGMAKLIMWNLMTLDGMFEGAQPWDLAFHEYAWGDELQRFIAEQTEEVGAVVFGRRTYEGMAAYWSNEEGETAEFMNSVPKYVFSRTLERADWANTTLLREDAGAALPQLKEQAGKNLFVFGSADLSATLLREGLYDELRIGLVPMTLGEGTPLFKPDAEPLKLRIVGSQALGERCHLLRYQPQGDTTA
jgi:dihydrofolate reductase